MSQDLVVGAAILDFDITTGDCVEQKMGRLVLADDLISAIAIPEGGHLVPEDVSYIVARDPLDNQPIFGVSLFCNRKDASVKRGARMKAMLLLCRRPYFAFFLPILRAGMGRHMDKTDKSILTQLVTRINQLAAAQSSGGPRTDSITLWGSSFAVDMPASLPTDHFALERGSLLSLVQRFREDTMLLWWALLLQLRLLFCGQPAGPVGACCLAVPLLAAPLQGFSEVISPYVPLSHPQQVEESKAGDRYICGVTNSIFAQKRKWFDALANLSTGSVTGPMCDEMRVRLSASERAFIRNVLSAVERDNRGEAWVREQFRVFTDGFLRELATQGGVTGGGGGGGGGGGRKLAHKEIPRLLDSQMFKEYARASRETDKVGGGGERGEGTSAMEHFRELWKADIGGNRTAVGAPAGGQGALTAEVSRLLFRLHTAISNANLDEIDGIVGDGAVGELSQDVYLQNSSSQVRKYATGVLATLCSTIRGQVAVLSSELLPRFSSMLLADTMPAVSAAAASCLHRTASLFVGSRALLDADVVLPLTKLLIDPPTDELLLRTLLASTLVQVYRYIPDAPRLAGAEARLEEKLGSLTAARELTMLIVELLDLWEAPPSTTKHPHLTGLLADVQPSAAEHARAIDQGDAETRAHAAVMLQSELTSRRGLAIPLVLSGAVEVLWAGGLCAVPNADPDLQQGSSLQRAALSTLAMLADTHCGLLRLIDLDALAALSRSLTPTTPPSTATAALRLLEVASQRRLGVAALKGSVKQLLTLAGTGTGSTSAGGQEHGQESLAAVLEATGAR